MTQKGTSTGSAEPAPTAVLNAAEVLEARTLVRRVELPDPVAEYAARLVHATRPDRKTSPEAVRRCVRYGASPRGAQALALAGRVNALMDGRANVAFEDIRTFAAPALRHRLILNFEGESEGVSADEIVAAVVEATPEA